MDPSVYCNASLTSEAHDIIAACIQANAAIRAGWLTFAAGALAAVIAAASAVAVIYAARLGIRLAERKAADEKKAFRRHIAALAGAAEVEINGVGDQLAMDPGWLIRGDRLYGFPCANAILELVNPNNWETIVRAGDRVSSHFDQVWVSIRQLLDIIEVVYKVDHKLWKERGSSLGELDHDLIDRCRKAQFILAKLVADIRQANADR
jgi:hypothetical protein